MIDPRRIPKFKELDDVPLTMDLFQNPKITQMLREYRFALKDYRNPIGERYIVDRIEPLDDLDTKRITHIIDLHIKAKKKIDLDEFDKLLEALLVDEEGAKY